jgi:PKD repeat protein
MKKILLSFFVIAISAYSVLAQVNREQVLVEVGTGTGCPYCPGAAMGLHDLYTNGDPVAGIEYHNYNSGDPFNTPEGAARTSYYGITAYPTSQFDGEYSEHVGGSSSSSLYSTFLPKVNSRMAIQSDFVVELYGQNTGNVYDVVVRVNNVSAYSGTNLAVRFALTETDIPYSWQGMSTIDYTERLMAPDENGTAVSFASGNSVDVNLTFTFNNTWVDSNCELIAWVQDDDNKYVLNSTSVMLLNLEADVANANFTSNNTVTCEGTAVEFSDLSTGAITSWSWTFEGGDPPTSTDQNPTVTYNTLGVYDVALYVSDGTTNSTLDEPDMIETIVPPVQPNTPAGETNVCANGTYVYTTNAIAWTDSYIWQVSPSDAGTISGDGIEGTFESDGSWTGAYTISVRADNSCGDGTWSTPINCNLNFTPAPFMLSEGGGMCEGSTGIEITQDGSETGIDYELYRNGTTTGSVIAGTGNPLSFGFQTDEGTYTVMAIATQCELQMYGTPWLYYLETPAQPSDPDGPTTACSSTTTNYSVSLIDQADTTHWELSPAGAGLVIGGYFEADIEWANDFSGTANLTAQGVNDCGSGPVSNPTVINVETTPSPEISGLTLVCNDEEADYTADEVTGNTYSWTVTGGSIVTGAGTSTISVLWGNPGNGIVSLVEATTNNCESLTEDYNVTIDDCIGIDESIANNEISIYPNPANNNIQIAFNQITGSDYSVVVYNNLGQVMTESTGIALGTNQTISIDVSKFKSGLYIVNLISDNGINIRSTFEKIK